MLCHQGHLARLVAVDLQNAIYQRQARIVGGYQSFKHIFLGIG